MEINSTMKENLNAVMDKRYNANLKAPDLSQFHEDPGEIMVIIYTEHSFVRYVL
jgi:hypothetical protein